MSLRTSILCSTVCAALLLATSHAGAARYFVHDWTIGTPFGRVGYAEFGYTPVLTQALGGNSTERLFFVGSRAYETRMSATWVAICGGVLSVGFVTCIGYFAVSYGRRLSEKRAA